MRIYGEMSMYGDIFIIDVQILIHAHAFSPPPVFTLCGNGVVAFSLPRKLTIGGKSGSELVTNQLTVVNKSPAFIFNRS